MADETGFAYELAHAGELKEIDIVAAVAWFLVERRQASRVLLGEVCDFIEGHGIRVNMNRSRLRTKFPLKTGVFLNKNDEIVFSLNERTKINEKFRRFLGDAKQEIKDTILELADFENQRTYVLALARQINACRQFDIFDGCAVLMRRLMEVLIIDAYEVHALRAKIVSGHEYLPLSGLIGVLTSGHEFKLSRNCKKWIDRCKEIGDNAAHSRTYITRKLDIDDFSGNYRSLIAELLGL